MTAIPIELPPDLQKFVEGQIQQGRFGSANDYIVALVESARNGRSAIEAALIDGLHSGPAEEWTAGEWAEIKQRVVERNAG